MKILGMMAICLALGMYGTPVFAGTRVPVKTLFDHLAEGDALDVFLEDFPTVSREHALAVFWLAYDRVITHSNTTRQAAE